MYRHTQIAWWAWAPALALVLVVAIGGRTGTAAAMLPVIFVMLAVAGLFGALTTTVDAGTVGCRFGPIGLIRRQVPLHDIRAARAVRTSPVWGWGLRWRPRGWLWNVWGLDAVELDLSSGGRFLVGTDEPERLLEALRRQGVSA